MNDLKVSVTEIKIGESSVEVIFECVDDSFGYTSVRFDVVDSKGLKARLTVRL